MEKKQSIKALKLGAIMVLLSFFGLVFIVSPVFPQKTYPNRNIELVCSYPPGGVVDTGTRAFADGLAKVIKVPVIVNNKGGASGTVGTAFAAKAKKDGYTLLATLFSSMEIAPITMGVEDEIPYVASRDFVPITMISDTPFMLVVRGDSPFKTVEDFIEFAKKNPGKLSYASAGVGQEGHLNGEIFQEVAKVKIKQIPFKSAGEQGAALLGGHVDFQLSTPPAMMSNILAGTYRALAVCDTRRLSALPEIPTFAEKGYSTQWMNLWVGLYAQTGVPKEIINVLAQASEKVIKSKEYPERLAKFGSSTKYFTQAAIKEYYEKDTETARALLKRLGLTSKK
ncbi:MAG: tripartite tricarboxylate transporter substrate binding protein [Deltaproteobacteria bacterium]